MFSTLETFLVCYVFVPFFRLDIWTLVNMNLFVHFFFVPVKVIAEFLTNASFCYIKEETAEIKSHSKDLFAIDFQNSLNHVKTYDSKIIFRSVNKFKRFFFVCSFLMRALYWLPNIICVASYGKMSGNGKLSFTLIKICINKWKREMQKSPENCQIIENERKKNDRS